MGSLVCASGTERLLREGSAKTHKKAAVFHEDIREIVDVEAVDWEELQQPPAVLVLDSPNGHLEVTGIYKLQERRANGQPVWKHDTAEYYVFSGTHGRWCVGGLDCEADDFEVSAGWIMTAEEHGTRMPDEFRRAGEFLRWDGTQFVPDAAVHIHSELLDEPGLYAIEEDRKPMLRRGVELTSEFVQDLEPGSIIEVLEVAHLGDRLRGRTRQGWLTLLSIRSGKRWATPGASSVFEI